MFSRLGVRINKPRPQLGESTYFKTIFPNLGFSTPFPSAGTNYNLVLMALSSHPSLPDRYSLTHCPCLPPPVPGGPSSPLFCHAWCLLRACLWEGVFSALRSLHLLLTLLAWPNVSFSGKPLGLFQASPTPPFSDYLFTPVDVLNLYCSVMVHVGESLARGYFCLGIHLVCQAACGDLEMTLAPSCRCMS